MFLSSSINETVLIKFKLKTTNHKFKNDKLEIMLPASNGYWSVTQMRLYLR